MDISDTLKADSTQLNAVDFIGSGPRTYTVASVRVVNGDQPVNIRLAEDADGREYRPSKSMRRVLAACWGPDSDKWTGKRLTLYTDPSVKWGGKEIGGIKISHVSGIDKAKKVMLQESSTVRKPHTVEPLTDAAPTSEPPPSEPLMSDGQRKILHKLVNQLGLTREQKIAGCVAVIQRPIESTSELSQTEARRVIERLEIKVAETEATS